MPRYFPLIWLICIIFGVSLAAHKAGIAAISVPFVLFIVAIGLLLSLLIVLIIGFAARLIGSTYDPFASRFDWRDDD